VSARALLAAGLLAAAACCASPARASGDPAVAALQVALRAHGLYAGPVNGVAGNGTAEAVVRFQRKKGLVADGIAGPLTRGAMVRRWVRPLGSRILKPGLRGWDVAELQFRLAWHGFPSGQFDAIFGPRTQGAVRRFQRWAGLPDDGRAGGATIAALTRPLPAVPIPLRRPVAAPITDVFGPRGVKFHTGLDFPAAAGAPVVAAAGGRVSYAGWHDGGYGQLVTIAHGGGVRTMYAHLESIGVGVGQVVAEGEQIGLVGATGIATGPHLHFEVRVQGAAADPAPAIRD
jgi:peptidoglycan hydrolase-like protein with peptidoglycan-binding domain